VDQFEFCHALGLPQKSDDFLGTPEESSGHREVLKALDSRLRGNNDQRATAQPQLTRYRITSCNRLKHELDALANKDLPS
jgi:hypothetical protein